MHALPPTHSQRNTTQHNTTQDALQAFAAETGCSSFPSWIKLRVAASHTPLPGSTESRLTPTAAVAERACAIVPRALFQFCVFIGALMHAIHLVLLSPHFPPNSVGVFVVHRVASAGDGGAAHGRGTWSTEKKQVLEQQRDIEGGMKESDARGRVVALSFFDCLRMHTHT